MIIKVNSMILPNNSMKIKKKLEANTILNKWIQDSFNVVKVNILVISGLNCFKKLDKLFDF